MGTTTHNAHLTSDQRSDIARNAATRRWNAKHGAALVDAQDSTDPADVIYRERARRGLSQYRAAREMGIGSVTLSRIESGNRNVGEEFVVKAMAWATAPPPEPLPPQHQRPQRWSEPRVPVVVLEPEPLPPAMLISSACPYWSRAQVAITEATCAWTAEDGYVLTCSGCPGIAALAAS